MLLTVTAECCGVPIPLETLEDWDRLDSIVRRFFAIAEEVDEGGLFLCDYCREPFSHVPSRTKRNHNIYCSMRCYQKAYRQMRKQPQQDSDIAKRLTEGE